MDSPGSDSDRPARLAQPDRPRDTPLVATINSTGRQAASLIRAASAVGWHVRAQIRNAEGTVAHELAQLPHVDIITGDLTDAPNRPALLARLFAGARLAFVNTTHWGDEVAIGRACADAARRARVAHYVYSSMPDHSTFGHPEWRPLPLWASKFAVENYVRALPLPATFIYTGIYHNNFTSLPYPLFQLELQPDRSFIWQAPFHPSDPLPWLDAEHDVGPALLQIFKMGPSHWHGQRVTLAFERLTPPQLCARFARGLARPVRYVHGPIRLAVPVPAGYHEHLQILQHTLADHRAPYFGPHLEYPREARAIWAAYRGIEAYARDVFPIEEWHNGLRWMEEPPAEPAADEAADADVDDDVPPSPRPITPLARDTAALHLSPLAAHASHPEAGLRDFFVGSC